MESRGNWTDLIAGVGLQIADVFDQGQEEYLPGINSALISTTSEAVAQKNFTGKTGAGRLKNFDDGDDINQTKRHKTYTTNVVFYNYGQSIEVTKNAIEDRDFANQLDEMKDLSIAANFSQDESGVQLFNGGFATTTTVNGYIMTFYGDGKPTFSTVHPTVVPGGSTQSNASATGIKFGHDNLEVAKVALVEQKTDDGIPVALMGKNTLVLPPALEREGKQEIETTLTPESANNAINVYKGNTDMIVSTFLAASNSGSDTAWFLEVVGRAKLYHEVRQAPRLEKDVNIKNKVVTFTIDARWANYVKDWRRTWASKGDLASYSS
jgi:phage major head subunit gpT-like protein